MKIGYRQAQQSDICGTLSVLEEIAHEVPLSIDTQEKRGIILQKIESCCTTGNSWVAVTPNNQIIGFLLVEPDEMERFLHNNNALYLAYAGVTNSYRGQRIFSELAKKVTARKVPITATVGHANTSSMLCRLIKLGFTVVSLENDRNKLRWDRAEYEAGICNQLPYAGVVNFKEVNLAGWSPNPSECHKNVDRWVEATSGHTAVRGWVFYKECLIADTIGLELTAHSVVCDKKGNLFDITPTHDERIRQFMRFVQHRGDEAQFWAFEKENRFICCPNCAHE